MIRGICAIDGCDKLVALKGIVNGKQTYRRVCSGHWRKKKGWAGAHRGLDSTKCELCGWVGLCDAHRIVGGKDGGTYSKGNVKIVCPNCHRLIHIGQLVAQRQGMDRDGGQKLLFKIA